MALTKSPVMAVKAIRPLVSRSSSGPMISWTSPPEQKFPPAPATTKARTESSRAAARKMAEASA
jgi:hypothetical protein